MPEVNLHDTFEGTVWAAEFCRIVGERVPAIREHEDWVATWFANAIMCGWDRRAREESND